MLSLRAKYCDTPGGTRMMKLQPLYKGLRGLNFPIDIRIYTYKYHYKDVENCEKQWEIRWEGEYTAYSALRKGIRIQLDKPFLPIRDSWSVISVNYVEEGAFASYIEFMQAFSVYLLKLLLTRYVMILDCLSHFWTVVWREIPREGCGPEGGLWLRVTLPPSTPPSASLPLPPSLCLPPAPRPRPHPSPRVGRGQEKLQKKKKRWRRVLVCCELRWYSRPL